ncbi:probable LRR receptor-like serine/threonine-protein kinase RFK1 isoform X1 [Salvia miltiorrhiza]|uniref:probable LRR receptor-like serine/threonine-protein kinase RFK1 isoform X1 n=1 Tax=Salvia miltiorrhiza TaxID=226208 RepID=UPI0025AC95A9|nr:probable LRR receptor-like serine/threonine-protein kinase RFK1 isoform X1 [Salvia miltiorrhiza]
MFVGRSVHLCWAAAVFCYWFSSLAESQRVPQDEVDVFKEIANELGAVHWTFDADLCELEMGGMSQTPPPNSDGYVECNCNFNNNSVCHVTTLVIKSYNLPGVLPLSIVKLQHLQHVDFAYNLLTGTIPEEWASMQLIFISVLVNRLSGQIPKYLANFTSLTYLNLEANQFSGAIPPDIGRMINLTTLILSSNPLTGELPNSLANLTNLKDFRINDNNLSGPIPDIITNWKQLTNLEMFASGLEGPIPSNISLLDMLQTLRISDLRGPSQEFPLLRSTTGLTSLILRNCKITGEIPAYIWKLRLLVMLDVSFNMLEGAIPGHIARNLKTVFVTQNKLSGKIPDTLLKDGGNIDLSYNNFTLQGPEEPACRLDMNRNVNLFKGSSAPDTLKRTLPCTKDVVCPRYKCSLQVNCGGNDLRVKEIDRRVIYEGDGGVDSESYLSTNNWGFVSTGDFLDEPDYQKSRAVKIPTPNLSDLYSSSRLSPLSLTYFHYCLENGVYNVSLHFAEIIFTNDNSSYYSLGKRMFDIYIQEELVHENFDIEDEARAAQKPVVRYFNANVTDNTLEIRFYWAGKGTTRIPNRGDYGSLISAISVDPTFKVCSSGTKKHVTAYIIAAVLTVFVILSILGILWWKGYLTGRKHGRNDLEGLDLQTVVLTLKQIRAATNNFDAANKIGEGGFGSVFKGQLPDGTVIAVKQLSSRSRQGNREFLNEIGMISCLQHPNLVKLYGCCIEGDQLLVVYEYMENNSLAHVLFESNGRSQMMLNWPTRFQICIGIARGLAFLHNESRLKIVHRDIKATNVLLDSDLNAKISDFGLARLNEDEKTHISTKVAGTIGYMAPEYALWGYLTDKADVYSFGVVLLEIVSGKSNNNYMPSHNFVCLLDWASHLNESKHIDELIDPRLDGGAHREEIERVVKIALQCTNATPSVRPTMSEVVQMLEGKMDIPVTLPEGSAYTNDVRFKAMKDFHQERQSLSTATWGESQISTTIRTGAGYSSSTSGFNEISEGSIPY